MTTNIVSGRHSTERATVPFLEIWNDENPTVPVPPSDGRQHRQFAPEQTTVRDLVAEQTAIIDMPISGTLQPVDRETPRRFGMWARFERSGKRIARVRKRIGDWLRPVEVDPPTVVALPPVEPPVPTRLDLVAIIDAAGARGIAWDVDPDYAPEICEWCPTEPPRITSLWVEGARSLNVCATCAPDFIATDPTTDDLRIELPGYGRHLIESARHARTAVKA